MEQVLIRGITHSVDEVKLVIEEYPMFRCCGKVVHSLVKKTCKSRYDTVCVKTIETI